MKKFPTYSLEKRGKKGIYRYCFYCPEYQRHRGSTGTSDEEAARRKTEKAILQTIRLIQEDGFNAAKEPCGKVFERFREMKSKGAHAVKPGTLLLYDSYSRRFQDYFGADKLLSRLTKQEVEKYRDDLLAVDVVIKGRQDKAGKQKNFRPRQSVKAG